MKKFKVNVPMAGYISFDIIAENENKAIAKALTEDWYMDDVQQLDMYKQLTEDYLRNVTYAKASAVFIENIDL